MEFYAEEAKRVDPILSIIVPVYNVSEFLDTCVQSILAQTFTNFELILVDDGSTDRSGKMCDSYAEKDSRISVIHKHNGGVVSARKAGIAAARGKYAGYVDGDDWIDKDMYAKMIDAIIKYDCDLVMCDIEQNSGARPLSTGGLHSGIQGGYYDRHALEKEIFPKMLYAGEFYEFGVYPVIWNKLYRRDKLIQFQLEVYNNINTGEDAACVYPYILSCDSLYFIEHCSLYHYRHSQNQMTAAFDNAHFERFKSLYDFFTVSDLAKSPYGRQLDYYFAYLTKISIGNELRRTNAATFREKLRAIRNICEFSVEKRFVNQLMLPSPTHRIYFRLVRRKCAFLLAMGVVLTRILQRILGGGNDR